MAPILRIVKGPNVKKLLALATLVTLALPALPAAAATNATGTATVKWNTTVAATLTLTTTYSWSSPTLTSGASATLYTGTAGTCANQSGETNGTVNYGTITPSLTANVNCLYIDAVNANLTTNSSSWTMYEQMNTPSPAALSGYTFCAYPNGYASFPAAVSATANPVNSGRSAGTADTTTCGASAVAIPTSTGTGVLSSSTGTATIATGTVATGASGTNVGEDLEMLIAPGATSGADQYSLQYLVIAN
jgi:hypothetical protein